MPEKIWVAKSVREAFKETQATTLTEKPVVAIDSKPALTETPEKPKAERNKICKVCGAKFYDTSYWNVRTGCKKHRGIVLRTPKNRCSACGRKLGNLGRGITDEIAKTLLCSFCDQARRETQNRIRFEEKRFNGQHYRRCQFCHKCKKTVDSSFVCAKCRNLLPKCGLCGKYTELNELNYCRECQFEINSKIKGDLK